MDGVTEMNSFCKEARARLTAARGDPFLHVEWHPAVFFNFFISPALLQPIIPKPFELQLHEGMACVSLAAVTMRNFRARRKFSPALPFEMIREQRFLNLRAYVSCGDEPGALFIHGWLSRPLGLPFPSAMFRLPYTFATLKYEHTGSDIAGCVTSNDGEFCYQAQGATDDEAYGPCSWGSAAEFAMERYSGFFSRAGQPYVFRVWHPPWQQAPLIAELQDLSLITNVFPWFGEAKLCGAHMTATLNDVWMGKAHRVDVHGPEKGNHHVLSAFYEMP